MDVLGFLKRKGEVGEVKSPRVNLDQAVTLTAVGKDKAHKMALKSPYFEVLNALLDSGDTANLKEISEATKFPVTQVKHLCESLQHSGYIKIVRV